MTEGRGKMTEGRGKMTEGRGKTVIKSVRDLKVYQMAYQLAAEVFEITKKFPKEGHIH